MLFILFMYATWDMYLNMDEIGYKQFTISDKLIYHLWNFACLFYDVLCLHCDILSWYLIEIILVLNKDLGQIKLGLNPNHIGSWMSLSSTI
jgi:hypothetical protein